jgi:hypothetical protein
MADPNKLNPDQVRDVLLSIGVETVAQTAQRLGRTRQAIINIQHGNAFASLYPELPRRQRRYSPRPGEPSCKRCQHWIQEPKPSQPPCDLGLPDVIEIGTGFAAECNLYRMQR